MSDMEEHVCGQWKWKCEQVEREHDVYRRERDSLQKEILEQAEYFTKKIVRIHEEYAMQRKQMDEMAKMFMTWKALQGGPKISMQNGRIWKDAP